MITEYLDHKVKSYIAKKWGVHSNRVKKSLEEKLKLLYLYILDEHQKVEESYFYVNISSKNLKKFKVEPKANGRKITIGYADLLNALEEIKAVQVEGRYKVGEYSKSYRPHKRAMDSPVINDPILFKHLKKADIQEYLDEYPTYSTNIMYATRVTIDIVRYQRWLYAHEGVELKPTLKKVKDEKGRDYPILTDRVLDQTRINRYLFAAYSINAGKLWFKVAKSGRLYENVQISVSRLINRSS